MASGWSSSHSRRGAPSGGERGAPGSRPLDNTDLTNAWRRHMVEVYVRRALREIAGLPVTDYEIQVQAH